MQVFVHVPIFQGVVGGFLGGVDGGVEVLELGGEAHADFEGIGHGSREGVLQARFNEETVSWINVAADRNVMVDFVRVVTRLGNLTPGSGGDSAELVTIHVLFSDPFYTAIYMTKLFVLRVTLTLGWSE